MPGISRNVWTTRILLVMGLVGITAWAIEILTQDRAPIPSESTTSAEPRGEELPTLDRLEPGTRVGEGPPSVWSHLVVKSLPRLASGDLASLPGSARETSALFRTLIVADVLDARKGGSGFELRRVGVGLCLPVRGEDTVVSSSSLRRLGLELSAVDRLVLGLAEDELAEGRLVARTRTFALFSTPAAL